MSANFKKVIKTIFDKGNALKSIEDVEKALQTIGVSVRNDDKSFKNLGDVLNEISKKWNLTKERINGNFN